VRIIPARRKGTYREVGIVALVREAGSEVRPEAEGVT